MGCDLPPRRTAANVSAAINLIAGRKYYIDAIHRAGGGADSVGVLAQLPGAAAPLNGDPPIQGANLSPYSTLGPIHITNDLPASISVNVSSQVTLGVGVDETPPYTYQWQRNGTNIFSAVLPQYNFSSVG